MLQLQWLSIGEILWWIKNWKGMMSCLSEIWICGTILISLFNQVYMCKRQNAVLTQIFCFNTPYLFNWEVNLNQMYPSESLNTFHTKLLIGFYQFLYHLNLCFACYLNRKLNIAHQIWSELIAISESVLRCHIENVTVKLI